MATTKYTVVSGDCLWNIAVKYYNDGTKYTLITDEDGKSIPSPYYIYPGQTLLIPDASGGGSSSSTNTSNKPKILFFGLTASDKRKAFAVWSWNPPSNKDKTDKYRVVWSYWHNSYGNWVVGDDSEITYDSEVAKEFSSYTAPDDSPKVKFKVKAISKTYGNNNTSYWTGDWSTESDATLIFANVLAAQTPSSAPKVEVKDYTLTIKYEELDLKELNADTVQFEVVQDNSTRFALSSNLKPNEYGYVAYTCSLTPGHTYTVRARTTSSTSNTTSEWSSPSETITPPPDSTCVINEYRVSNYKDASGSVYLSWSAVSGAKSYAISYTTDGTLFENNIESSDIQEISGIEGTSYQIPNVAGSKTYFFRVKAVNETGDSEWSAPVSLVIGSKPTAPTTWSSTTTAISGEKLTLFWVHNCEDNSTQTFAQIELTVGESTTIETVETKDQPDDEKTMHLDIDTSQYSVGAKLLWRVCTAGITQDVSEWSVQRTVDIHAQPTINLRVTDSKGNDISTLTSFPIYISAIAGPNTQTPISYHISVIANESYETYNSIGNIEYVVAGSEIYSKHFDASTELVLELSAGHINLENNVSYTVKCVVSMNSGLTAEGSKTFTVSWKDLEYEPNAELGIDKDSLSAYIRPYCLDESGRYISGITLSVYRREFDGGFTEIATGIDNTAGMFVTDPHPALDYARYRVVAIDDSTGAVSYYDMPGHYVGESSVIIQWNEKWSSFDAVDGFIVGEKPWTGSLLKLPYNIDVSDSNSPDVAHVNYIGRRHPVTYYGTHTGDSATWNVDVVKSDKDTLYALRRLASWLGDVYVREPSGSGYWASITVSFNQKHRELVIPVTLNITRVTGGM